MTYSIYLTFNINYMDRDYQLAERDSTTNKLRMAESHLSARRSRTEEMERGMTQPGGPEDRLVLCHNQAIKALSVSRMVHADSLDSVFHIGNVGPTDGTREFQYMNANVAVPSTSVGHVILKLNGPIEAHSEHELYMVMNCGFARVRCPNMEDVIRSLCEQATGGSAKWVRTFPEKEEHVPF